MGINTIGIRAESIVEKKEKIIFGFMKQISIHTEGKREPRKEKLTESRKIVSAETETVKVGMSEQHQKNGEKTEMKEEKEESEQREKENEQMPSEMKASQEQSE
jgi:hypothetical protein